MPNNYNKKTVKLYLGTSTHIEYRKNKEKCQYSS